MLYGLSYEKFMIQDLKVKMTPDEICKLIAKWAARMRGSMIRNPMPISVRSQDEARFVMLCDLLTEILGEEKAAESLKQEGVG